MNHTGLQVVLRYGIACLCIVFLFQSCLFRKNISSVESSETDKLWGIDISHYQEIMDWEKIAEHEPGFIFVKATEGATFQDPKYLENYQQVRKHRIPVGSYHFFSYKSCGRDQAINFLTVAKFHKGDLPLVLDIEFARKMPSKTAICAEVMDFISAVHQKTRTYPIIYCDYRFYLSYLKEKLPSQCHLWIVDYKGRPNCNWTFWQTTDRYSVGGIRGRVDFNLFSGCRKDFRNLLL